MTKFLCSGCKVKSGNKRCSKCLVVFYCSKKCQILDWKKEHRELCLGTNSLSMVSCDVLERKISWESIKKQIKKIGEIMKTDPSLREEMKQDVFFKIMEYMRQNKIVCFSKIEKKIRKFNPQFYLIATPISKKERNIIGDSITNIYRKKINAKYIIKVWTADYIPPNWKKKSNIKKLKRAGVLMYLKVTNKTTLKREFNKFVKLAKIINKTNKRSQINV